MKRHSNIQRLLKSICMTVLACPVISCFAYSSVNIYQGSSSETAYSGTQLTLAKVIAPEIVTANGTYNGSGYANGIDGTMGVTASIATTSGDLKGALSRTDSKAQIHGNFTLNAFPGADPAYIYIFLELHATGRWSNSNGNAILTDEVYLTSEQSGKYIDGTLDFYNGLNHPYFSGDFANDSYNHAATLGQSEADMSGELFMRYLLQPGEKLSVDLYLGARADAHDKRFPASASLDASHTSSIKILVPTGYTLTSSNNFLSGAISTVPEANTIIYALLGSPIIVGALRRRGSQSKRLET
jgi:hypothetical protein